MVRTVGPVSYSYRRISGVMAVEPAPAGEARRVLEAVLASTLERTAQALEHSAALAEQHAQREEQAGRHDEAAHERRVAAEAREAARRARCSAEEKP